MRDAIFEASAGYFLAPVASFLEDETVTEIMVNGFDQVYIERRGRLERTDARFASHDALLSAVHNIAQWVGRRIDEEQPILDARLPNGSRVHAIIPPNATRGIYLTIRKFAKGGLSLGELTRQGTLSAAGREFLELCVRLRKNIIISGGTGAGKTSLLNALSRAIPESERIVVIEDTSELRLAQRHCLYLEASPAQEGESTGVTVRRLFASSLRMRPDRIIVGEVRGGEALDMLQSMLSGHSGSLSTVHANQPRDALTRLETLSLMSDIELPIYVARAQVASAVHLIVQISRFSEDGSRRVTRVTEVRGLNAENQYIVADLLVLRPAEGKGAGPGRLRLEPTGEVASFAQELRDQGLDHLVERGGELWGKVS